MGFNLDFRHTLFITQDFLNIQVGFRTLFPKYTTVGDIQDKQCRELISNVAAILLDNGYSVRLITLVNY